MRSHNLSIVIVSAALLLGACGGGMGGSNSSGSGDTGPPPRGTLLESPPALLSTLTAVNLLAELNLATNLLILSASGAPVCDLLMYHIQYETVDGANQPPPASAPLMGPTGLGPNCTGPRPVLLYAHGPTTDRAFTMDNLQNTETLNLVAIFATKG